jgi:hypothetical protein
MRTSNALLERFNFFRMRPVRLANGHRELRLWRGFSMNSSTTLSHCLDLSVDLVQSTTSCKRARLAARCRFWRYRRINQHSEGRGNRASGTLSQFLHPCAMNYTNALVADLHLDLVKNVARDIDVASFAPLSHMRAEIGP